MQSSNIRSVVLTGAAGGIGAAVARRLAARGDRLLLSDLGCSPDGTGRDDGRLEELAAELRATGAVVATDTRDVRDAGVVAHLLERAESELGPVCGFVHAAGIHRESSVAKLTEADLGDVLDLHVRTSFAVVRECAERLSGPGRSGSIVLFTSPSAFFGAARQAASAAAAAAVAALVRTAALELRKFDIRVNAVAPTARTRQTEDSPLFKSIRADSMTADQVAPLVSYLLSASSSEVSGEWLGAAGGRIYSLGARESTGAFLGPKLDEAAIAAAFGEIVRS